VGGAAEIAGFSNKETSRQAGKVVDIGTPELVRAMDCDLFRDQPSGAGGNRHGQVERSERSVGLHLMSED
jgi:hypothetical protein